MLINKTPRNIQLKILAGYLLPASLHEDEMLDSSLPEPETSLCRLCPELQGARLSFQLLLFRKTRRNRDTWRREGKKVIRYPSMLYEGKLHVFISDGNTLQSKPFCEPPKLFMKRTYAHLFFFHFYFPPPLHINLKILQSFSVSHFIRSIRPDPLLHHSLRVKRSELAQR